LGEISRKGGESETSHRTRYSTDAQLSISNFLYPAQALGIETIPERFLKFCRQSIEIARGDVLTPETQNQFGSHIVEFEGDDGQFLDLGRVGNGQIIPLKPAHSDRQVVAIDTSAMKVGELSSGSLCAVRGAVVILDKARYRFAKYGPLIFSIGSSNEAEIFNLAKVELKPLTRELNVEVLLKRIRNLIERWLQYSVANSAFNTLILVDGSLTAGTPDNPTRDLERTLETARRNEDVIIAISKKTRLRIQDRSITELLGNREAPCLLNIDQEIEEQFPPFPVRLLGRVFVGRLAPSGFSFRMDVDRELGIHETVNGFCELIGTDVVDQGYPETLRLAHVLATFTASDVLAIQASAAQYGVQIAPRFALRRSLFGPFGTSWETWH